MTPKGSSEYNMKAKLSYLKRLCLLIPTGLFIFIYRTFNIYNI